VVPLLWRLIFVPSRVIIVADSVILLIDGEVDRPARLSLADLAAVESGSQVADVGRLDPKRHGQAVTLAGLLNHVGVRPAAQYLTLHSATDDFHASIPLAAVRERGLLIYALDGGPLPAKAGGPVRFLIPDYAACHTEEVDECANVKFVDHIELTATRGRDNRPSDEQEHADLHRREGEAKS
jgi:DMSO/TMAO reductase YedYZ molybdopterin-dependent catalytic subunit